MDSERESPGSKVPSDSKGSDKQTRACYGEQIPPVDNSIQGTKPQDRKAEKIRTRVSEWTHTDMPFAFAVMAHNAVRTGLRVTNKEEEEYKGYPTHCNEEYHFRRMTGPGAELVSPLYNCSVKIAGESKDFHVRLQALAKFLAADDDSLYAAAELLVLAGFFEVVETKLGKATMYRPLFHREWAAKCGTKEWGVDKQGQPRKIGRFCTVKAEFPFKETSAEYQLGQKLYGITGEKYFAGVLKNWTQLGTIDELLSWAKDFMAEDGGNGDGVARRVRLGKYLRGCAARKGAK